MEVSRDHAVREKPTLRYRRELDKERERVTEREAGLG